MYVTTPYNREKKADQLMTLRPMNKFEVHFLDLVFASYFPELGLKKTSIQKCQWAQNFKKAYSLVNESRKEKPKMI